MPPETGSPLPLPSKLVFPKAKGDKNVSLGWQQTTPFPSEPPLPRPTAQACAGRQRVRYTAGRGGAVGGKGQVRGLPFLASKGRERMGLAAMPGGGRQSGWHTSWWGGHGPASLSTVEGKAAPKHPRRRFQFGYQPLGAGSITFCRPTLYHSVLATSGNFHLNGSSVSQAGFFLSPGGGGSPQPIHLLGGGSQGPH